MTRQIAALILTLVVAASACKKGDSSTSAPATPATTATPATAPAIPQGAPAAVKPVPAQLPDIVARVNGESVSRIELEQAIQTLETRARSAVPPDQRDAVFRQVLDRVIGFHLLVQEARVRKVVTPPWEVDGQINEIKKGFPSEDAFNKMLQERGVTLDRLRQETSDTMAVNLMLQHEIEPQVKVTDADLKTFFDQNKPRFRQEDSVHASHILIRADQQADAATKAKAKGAADDVLKQLRNGGNFADLAKKLSQDPGSAPNGGDLGFFSRGQMVPPFEQAAFALKPGQTSGVVETSFGYHIIHVSEAKAARDLGFDEVKEQIKEYLTTQQRDQKSQGFVDQLKAKGKIEVLI